MPTIAKAKSKPKSNKEIRSYAASGKPSLSLRAGSDGQSRLKGTAIVYNVLSEDLGGFRERIRPGAVTKSLRNKPDVQILNSHESGQILGRVSSGTATVTDSNVGLSFVCSLGNSSHALDVKDMVQRGDVKACSFGFICLDDSWSIENDVLIRDVIEADLFELSVVGSPAYSQTSVSLRSLPTEYRSKITKRDEDDQDEDCDPELDDDCEDEEDRCDCGLDDCERCMAQDDQERQDKLRLRSLFAHRMN